MGGGLSRGVWQAGLVTCFGLLIIGAAVVVFRGTTLPIAPIPSPVAEGDHEIVWLYAATNAAAWERFVAAVKKSVGDLKEEHPDVEVDPSTAFPQQTTAVPEVALVLPPGRTGSSRDGRQRLVFRWYKLTGDWNTRAWIEALRKRDKPPLAVIGGSSSDAARELARYLNEAWPIDPASGARADGAPLLLLTTATANRVTVPMGNGEWGMGHEEVPRGHAPVEGEEPEDPPGVGLNQLYAGRTFRFCFTNRRMASAVTSFLWTQDDLRPDNDPVYMVQWNDDSYSRDLVEGFWKALRGLVTRQFVLQWGWITGCVGTGAPPALQAGCLAAARGSRCQLAILPTPQLIDSSVGSFATPNRFEAKVARDLLDLLAQPEPRQERALLMVTGQSGPSRRFLRALARAAPGQARRLVVATGDALAFNNVYRDRQVTWPIQDLPFKLVFFCHHNPVDPNAGFRPYPSEGRGPRGMDEEPVPPEGGSPATGTEDVLLYMDMVEALVRAFQHQADAPSAAELGEKMAEMRVAGGRLTFAARGTLLFRDNGNRSSGTGEHVVCLRPTIDPEGGRILPEATIEVWAWRADESTPFGPSWQRCGEPLRVPYDDMGGEGGAHGFD
jgi:hypothetical protein